MTPVSFDMTQQFNTVTIPHSLPKKYQLEEGRMIMLSANLLPEIESRKSETHWSDTPINKDNLDCIIEATRRTPSSWNHQPARYIILNDKEAIQQLCKALHRTNYWAVKASALVVQVADPETDDRIDGKDYYLYDCGLAMMSMIYQAQALGITSRQMIGWDEAEIKSLLMIPERYRVVVITGMGFLTESKTAQIISDLKRNITHQQKRLDRKHLIFWKTWGKGESFDDSFGT
jgi:nitroreductase